MSDLGRFAAYCRRMSTADHVDDCRSLAPPARPRWRLTEDLADLALDGFTPTPPTCDGCVSPEERELWAQMADELESHLELKDTPPLF